MKFKFGTEAQEALVASTGMSYKSLVSEPVSAQNFVNTPGPFSLSSSLSKRRIIKPRGTIYLFSGRKMSLKSVCKKVFGY